MTSRNNITGDKLQSKVTTQEYRDGWDAIFGKAGYSKPTEVRPRTDYVCCGKCSPCKGHEVENQKDEEDDRQVQESK